VTRSHRTRLGAQSHLELAAGVASRSRVQLLERRLGAARRLDREGLGSNVRGFHE